MLNSDLDLVKELLVKLAAMAPNEIPDWYKHNEIKMPVHPESSWDLRKEDQKEVHSWLQDDAGCDLPPHLRWIQSQVEQYFSDYAKATLENKKARYFQWRIFYATSLVKELNSWYHKP